MPNDFRSDLTRELERIGLDLDRCPYDGMGTSGEEASARFLAHLRSLAPGATWRDVFPDMPAHWNLDRRSTWTYPYRPLHRFDYARQPAGPALMVRFPREATDADLASISQEAAQHGWQVHGARFSYIEAADWPNRPAIVVLDVATTKAQAEQFLHWLEERFGIEAAYIHRKVGERFAPRTRATQLFQVVRAPRSAVYAALVDPAAVQQWMVPDGMSSIVHEFDAREGGRLRISLTYTAPSDKGKSSDHTDTYHGRFVQLVPDRLVVQEMEFETSDPAMQGLMTATFILNDDVDGTEIVARHEQVPKGIRLADNDEGWRMSLGKLATLVEAAAR